MDKRIRDLKRLVKKYGLELAGQGRGGHWKIVDAEGNVVAVASSSASDWRQMKRLESDLKRSVQPRPLVG